MKKDPNKIRVSWKPTGKANRYRIFRSVRFAVRALCAGSYVVNRKGISRLEKKCLGCKGKRCPSEKRRRAI